jgi:hypothetical protein
MQIMRQLVETCKPTVIPLNHLRAWLGRKLGFVIYLCCLFVLLIVCK